MSHSARPPLPIVLHVNDVQTVLEATIHRREDNSIVNLAGATVLRMILRDADGVQKIRTAVLSTDGTDGKVRYTTADGDLDTPGWWELQCFLELSGGKWHSSIFRFEVQSNLAISPSTSPSPS